MKPVITFSDDSVGDGAVSVVLSKLVGFTFEVMFDAGTGTVLHESIKLTGEIVDVSETEVVLRRANSAMESHIPIGSIEFMEYQ